MERVDDAGVEGTAELVDADVLGVGNLAGVAGTPGVAVELGAGAGEAVEAIVAGAARGELELAEERGGELVDLDGVLDVGAGRSRTVYGETSSGKSLRLEGDVGVRAPLVGEGRRNSRRDVGLASVSSPDEKGGAALRGVVVGLEYSWLAVDSSWERRLG